MLSDATFEHLLMQKINCHSQHWLWSDSLTLAKIVFNCQNECHAGLGIVLKLYCTENPECIVKEVNLYSAFIVVPHTQGAQVRITQCYLQITPYLHLPHKCSPDGASPDWGWGHLIAAYYSFIYPERMKGWVGLVDCAIADGLKGLLWCYLAYHSLNGSSGSVDGDLQFLWG